MLHIAFIAHNCKKEEMVHFATAYKRVFKEHQLYATGTTGRRIIENTHLAIHCFKSGPLGGDQQVGAMVANNELDLIFFLRDPLMPQPHEPDINALLRLCDVQNIAVATNMATAEVLAKAVQRGDFAWRELINPRQRSANK